MKLIKPKSFDPLVLIEVLYLLAEEEKKYGPQGVEKHLESPNNSSILKRVGDQEVIDTLCSIYSFVTSYLFSPVSYEAVFMSEGHLGKERCEVKMIKRYFFARIHNNPTRVCIESARLSVPFYKRPSLQSVDILNKKISAAES